jgi:hypothetical protein
VKEVRQGKNIISSNHFVLFAIPSSFCGKRSHQRTSPVTNIVKRYSTTWKATDITALTAPKPL